MTSALVINETGGPEVLQWQDIELESPKAGEVRIKHTAAGLNYIDTYFRQGIFPLPNMPGILGAEGVGVITELGDGVSDLSVGDRVVYSAGFGSYCLERNILAEKLVKVPDDIDDITAAGCFSKGTTAEFLLLRAYPRDIQPGDYILVHAAAGGVGQILCQWANHLGANVIGTVGSEEKAEVARNHGCRDVINYSTEDFVERVSDITDGKGVCVVFDAVGKSTFEGSLDCLQPRGFLINFGTASGPPPKVDPTDLMHKGSVYVTRASLFHYNATPADLSASAEKLFAVIREGGVKVNVNQTYPLQDAAQAHQDLADRKLIGSTVLIP
ncbi:quinone oxidoreductase [Pseudomaricurvus alkylphenolicus]|uniref:quinone oxidoreductase family protein n=1 Tax=Pseudomaricurvus alkylphenolicus TaxID=1306991 RepID=UPI00142163F4|nr:quinone oxidoreductase [Pseudomaricurvus alkylphenolicus]NIB40831.1 quinone oxidoreductase [Pseudomaricurvus alkylphenolicus]